MPAPERKLTLVVQLVMTPGTPVAVVPELVPVLVEPVLVEPLLLLALESTAERGI